MKSPKLPYPKLTILAVIAAGFLIYSTLTPSYTLEGPAIGEGQVTVIMLHGYGMKADDLTNHAEMINREIDDITFIFPQAPHRASGGCGGTWQPDYAQTRTDLVDGRQQSVDELVDLIEELQRSGVALQDLYLAGYSQGAAMATFMTTSVPELPQLRGLIVVNGDFLPHSEEDPRSTDQLPDDFRVLVVHGNKDRVFSIAKGRAIAGFFEENNVNVEFVELDEGHGFNPRFRRPIVAFLKEHN